MNARPDELSLLTGSYAVDAVDEAERAALDAAILGSDDMRAETDSLRATALLLAYAVEPVEPPAALKASIMAKIATTPQRGATPAHAESAPPVVLEERHAPVTDVRSATSGTAASTARARWFQRPVTLITSAAAAVAVIAGATIGVNALVQPSAPTSSVQASTSLDQIYAAADFKRSSADVEGGGTATVVWSDRLGKSAVVFKGVKAAPSGKTYELWYIGSTTSSAGLVNSVDGGTTSAVLAGKKAKGDTIGITIEPAGGSKQPTTSPIVAVSTSNA